VKDKAGIPPEYRNGSEHMPQSHFVYAREVRSDRRRDSARVRGSGAPCWLWVGRSQSCDAKDDHRVAGADGRDRLRFS